MDNKVKKPTYYELHKEERKKYQHSYREDHLEQVRIKDRERKRDKSKGDRSIPQPIFNEGVLVKFD